MILENKTKKNSPGSRNSTSTYIFEYKETLP